MSLAKKRFDWFRSRMKADKHQIPDGRHRIFDKAEASLFEGLEGRRVRDLSRLPAFVIFPAVILASKPLAKPAFHGCGQRTEAVRTNIEKTDESIATPPENDVTTEN